MTTIIRTNDRVDTNTTTQPQRQPRVRRRQTPGCPPELCGGSVDWTAVTDTWPAGCGCCLFQPLTCSCSVTGCRQSPTSLCREAGGQTAPGSSPPTLPVNHTRALQLPPTRFKVDVDFSLQACYPLMANRHSQRHPAKPPRSNPDT